MSTLPPPPPHTHRAIAQYEHLAPPPHTHTHLTIAPYEHLATGVFVDLVEQELGGVGHLQASQGDIPAEVMSDE